MQRIQRALISVFDKTGVVEFAEGLRQLGVEILSTGGTAKLLTANKVPNREVSDLTGFPEILDGRVKTINPRIAAGVLAIRDNADHMRQLAQHDVRTIDLVCINLYPFVQTTRIPGVTFPEIIENIDIGGPSLLRAAAKNFQDVVVVTDPLDYSDVLRGLNEGAGTLSKDRLFALAQKAFVCTARYDGQIAQHLSRRNPKTFDLREDRFPEKVFLDFERVQTLRYGENPHQAADFLRHGGGAPYGVAAARQLHGKELSFNNIVDLEAAWNLIGEFQEPACAIIKHTNPCGTAIGDSLTEAYLRAHDADPVSAFGSIIAVNREVDPVTATEMSKLFVEAVIAPSFHTEAIEILGRKKNLRLIEMPSQAAGDWQDVDMKRVAGGMLLQDVDREPPEIESKVVTARKPTPDERVDLMFAWRVAKHVKSNAIVIAAGGRTIGVGAGQMSRVDSVRISIEKAGPQASGAALASDAFFPFRDGIDEAARAGIRAIIQPGGSVRDEEVIAAANEHGIAMVLTGIRHFKH